MENDLLSIIIPVYNTAKYLDRCLESVLNQTYKSLEIICVDDGSTDTSPEILKKYAVTYPQLKIISHQENRGMLAARTTGVENAIGEFIQFMDSDDAIDPKLCQCAIDLIKKYDTDIVEFSARQIDTEKNKRITLDPKCDKITGDEILPAHFVTRNVSTSLVTKIFRSTLCKKTFSKIPRMYCNAGEDIMTSFFLAYHASSYIGVKTSPKYNYYYGLGLSTSHKISLEKYKSYCEMSAIPSTVKILFDGGETSDNAKISFEHMTRRLISDCCIYYSQVPDEDKDKALMLFKEHWGNNEFLPQAITSLYVDYKELIEELYQSESFKLGNFFVSQIYNIPKYFKKSDTQTVLDINTTQKDLLSLIIPVYNTSKYLERCLDSVLNQTYENLEIICVDDGSTDGSLDILKKYAQSCPRFMIIQHDKNKGLFEARRTGVLNAHGKYIQFLDSDDTFDNELCSCIISLINQHNVDILEFSTRLVDVERDDVSFFEPKCGRIGSTEILREFFITRNISTSLVMKVYRSELCKKAFSKIPEVHCYAGEDVLTSFFLAYYAESYIGVSTEPKYNYFLGLGISTGKNMSIEKFTQYCKMNEIPVIVRAFLKEEKASSAAVEACEYMTRRLIGDCLIYYSRITDLDRKRALQIYLTHWSEDDMFLKGQMSIIAEQKKMVDEIYESETYKLGNFFISPLYTVKKRFCKSLAHV